MPHNARGETGAAATTDEAAFDIRKREELILGQPPRIAPLQPEEYTEEAREIAASLRRSAGLPPWDYVPEVVSTLLRHPDLSRSHFETGIRLLGNGLLTPRDRELVVLRTGWLCRSPYEWGEHVAIGKRIGLTSEEIERVTRGSGDSGWDEHDRALLQAAEELHADSMISDATWAALARRLDERQLIELLLLVGQYHAVAYYLNALRLRMMDGNPGLAGR